MGIKKMGEFKAAALDEAKGSLIRQRVGVVLVTRTLVVSRGVNIWTGRSHRGWTEHAEANAILKAARNGVLKDHKTLTLFVARLTPGGRPAMSLPCDSCADLIRWAGIHVVHYTEADGGWERVMVKEDVERYGDGYAPRWTWF